MVGGYWMDDRVDFLRLPVETIESKWNCRSNDNFLLFLSCEQIKIYDLKYCGRSHAIWLIYFFSSSLARTRPFIKRTHMENLIALK
jgi:hypothetical protein